MLTREIVSQIGGHRRDFVKSAGQLLPKGIGCGCVTLFGAILENSGGDLEYLMY